MHFGPLRSVHLMRQVLPVQSGKVQELGVEFGLNCPDRDVFAVRGFVNVIKMSTAVQYVFPAPVGPDAHRLEAIEDSHQ